MLVAVGRRKALAPLEMVRPLGRPPPPVGVQVELVRPPEQLAGLGQLVVALGQVVMALFEIDVMALFMLPMLTPGDVVIALR